MSNFLTLLVALASVDCCTLVDQNSETENGPRLSVSEIYTQAMHRIASITSLRVQLIETWKKLNESPSRKFDASLETPTNYIFAFDGPRRYLKRWTESKSGKPTTDERCYIYDGDNTYMIKIGSVSVSAGKEPQCDDENYADPFLNIPVSDRSKSTYDRAWYFPHCIRPEREKNYSILPDLEMVHGNLCHVLYNPKGDKVWVDPKIGCAVRKRERFTPGPTGGQGDFLFSYDMSDFYEVSTNIWVPKTCKQVYFMGRENPSQLKNKPWVEVNVAVRSISINKPVDDLFNPLLSPGTLIVNDKGSTRLGGGQGHLLAEIAERVKAQTSQEKTNLYMWLLATILTIFLGLVLLFIFYRKKKTSKPPLLN